MQAEQARLEKLLQRCVCGGVRGLYAYSLPTMNKCTVRGGVCVCGTPIKHTYNRTRADQASTDLYVDIKRLRIDNDNMLARIAEQEQALQRCQSKLRAEQQVCSFAGVVGVF